MTITFIALISNITFDDNDRVYLRKFKVNYWLNVDTLSNMKLIEKVQNGGWRLIIAGGNNENDQVGEEPIGEEQELPTTPSDPIMPKSSFK